MSNPIKVALFVLLLFVSLLTTTLVALELSGVVTVQTVNFETGEVRETHIWYIEKSQNSLILEAGTPTNPWVLDLDQMESLTLVGDGRDGEYLFTKLPPDSHTMIRAAMRDKYGWRDWWISLLFDTSQSYAMEVQRL